MKSYVVSVLVTGNAGERVAWCGPLLARMGWQVLFVTADTVEACFDEIQSGAHDLAILAPFDSRDVGEIAADLPPEESRCPVIVLSDVESREDLISVLESGAWDCLAPDEPERLLVSIRHAVMHSLGERRHRVVQSRLAERESSLRAITSHIPGMVFRLWVTDTETRFVYVSEGAESLLRTPLPDIVGRRDVLTSAVVDEDRPALQSALDQSRSGRSSLDWTGRLDVDGEVTWVNVRGSVACRDGRAEIDGVAIDVTASMESEQKLLSTMFELETLTKRLQDIREEERQRITREVHDELGSLLTAIKMEVFSLGCWVERSVEDRRAFEYLTRQLKGLGERLNSAVETVRRIARELRPRILDDFGVAVAIDWYVSEFARSVGLRVGVEIDSDIPPLDDQVETALFRIAQEALTNVARHAEADHVSFALGRREEALEFVVEDDGVGLDEEALSCPESTGLVGMRERVRRLGGAMEVTASGARGTRLRFTFPLKG